MKISKILSMLIVVFLGLFATSMSAYAASAVAKSAANVRSGPGISYAKVDVLYAGEKVTITQCQSGWCYVKHPGSDGWVSGNYLAPATGGSSSANEAATKAFIEIFGAVVGGIINPPAPATPKICFFNGVNYTGSTFCVNAGTNNNKLVGYWNNKISSIKVPAGSSVTVCRNWFYGGGCFSYNSNRPNLFMLNNQTSSFQTF